MDNTERTIIICVFVLIIGSIYYSNYRSENTVKLIENSFSEIEERQEIINNKIQELTSKEDIKELQEFMKEQKEMNLKQAEFNQVVVKTFYRLYPNR